MKRKPQKPVSQSTIQMKDNLSLQLSYDSVNKGGYDTAFSSIQALQY
ncbi:hypothetical protein VA7868_00854 [Vibrio aerogenes CECT 7868]|uniref:Uncharacterized protein n=1 Tax=Vibrio aerogenes CECT 7868 TaxID=1216006 RepID=A0A1M5WSQ1_9VIBR|nr:hypothetical protein VA7868_00854 [Vibrio aerogenes CECT 7868]